MQRKIARLEAEAARLRDDNRRLQESLRLQRQLDLFMDASLDPIWIGAEDVTIKAANRSFLALVGCASMEEVAGKYVWDFSPNTEGSYESTSGEQVVLDGAYFADFEKEAEKLVERGVSTNWKFYYYNKNSGKVVPTTQNIIFMYDGQGEYVGSFGVIHDLTEIRAAEHRIDVARGFLQNIFDTAGDGLLVTDITGAIIMANKCYGAMIGYPDEDLTGRFVYELGLVEIGAEPAVPRSIELLLEQGFLKDYETVYRRRDGATVEVELNMTCLMQDDGSLSGIVSSIRDITERRRAQAALRDSEEKYRTLVDNLSVGVFRSRLDARGTIVHANPGLASMAGFASAQAMQGAAIASFYENLDERKAVLREILASGGLRGREILLRKPDGEVRWVAISATLMYDRDGAPYCLDGIIEDITERKRAAEFLQQSHERLEAMVEARTTELQEANTALRILLQKREEDKARLEETMLYNIQKLVAPTVEKLRSLEPSPRARACLDIISETVSHIAEPLIRGKSPSLLNLTAAEIQIVNLIKQRRSTREIASLTGLSPRTVDRHRDNIRKKLGLSNTRMNLTTYLMSLD